MSSQFSGGKEDPQNECKYGEDVKQTTGRAAREKTNQPDDEQDRHDCRHDFT